MPQVTGEVELPPSSLAAQVVLLQVQQHDAFWAGRLDEVKRLTDEQIATIKRGAGLATEA
jgi:hypothetical protein